MIMFPAGTHCMLIFTQITVQGDLRIQHIAQVLTADIYLNFSHFYSYCLCINCYTEIMDILRILRVI